MGLLRTVRNKLAMRHIEVKCEGDPRKYQYPDVMIVHNKNTGEKWSVDIEREWADIDMTYTAVLKDEKGKRLEACGIIQDTSWMIDGKRCPDDIFGYSPKNEAMWRVINSEFKKYQKIHIDYDEKIAKVEKKTAKIVDRYKASHMEK